MRWYALLNQPWVYGSRWWRARRVSKEAARRLDADHVVWARSLKNGR